MRLCSIDGCNKKHEAKGLCKSHYRRFKRYGDPLGGVKSKRKTTQSYEENHKVVDDVNYKKCSICNLWLPLNEEYFYKNKSSPDGFNPYCKKCTKEKNWKHQQKNKYWLKAYKNNTDFYKKKAKKWSKENKERHQELTSDWRKNNKDKLKEYGIIRQKTKKHNITKKEWLSCKEYFNNSCAYCGLHKDDHYTTWNSELKKMDLHKEHVDDDGANDLSNCVPSCKSCNSSKHTAEFQEWFHPDINKYYTEDRMNKILKWLQIDYKKYIRKELLNK